MTYNDMHVSMFRLTNQMWKPSSMLKRCKGQVSERVIRSSMLLCGVSMS